MVSNLLLLQQNSYVFDANLNVWIRFSMACSCRVFGRKSVGFFRGRRVLLPDSEWYLSWQPQMLLRSSQSGGKRRGKMAKRSACRASSLTCFRSLAWVTVSPTFMTAGQGGRDSPASCDLTSNCVSSSCVKRAVYWKCCIQASISAWFLRATHISGRTQKAKHFLKKVSHFLENLFWKPSMFLFILFQTPNNTANN